jgi:hypothetical protein
MSKFDQVELSVCTVCLCLLANGEFNDGTDADEIAGACMARIWGDNARHLVADGEDLGLSTSPCDACGATHLGARYTAFALLPIQGGETS